MAASKKKNNKKKKANAANKDKPAHDGLHPIDTTHNGDQEGEEEDAGPDSLVLVNMPKLV